MDAADDKRLVLKSTWTSNALTTSTTVIGCFAAIFAILQFVPPVVLNEFICSVLSRAWFQIVQPMSGIKLNLIVSAVASLIGAPVICVTTYALFGKFSDGSLQLTEQGITLPIQFLLPLRFRLNRTWKDLKEFELLPSNLGKLQLDDKLRLTFHSGGSVSIGRSQLSEIDLLCLVDSVDEMASDCLVPARLLSVRREVIEQMPEPPAGTRSITELWDDEFARKYRSTAFVPREPGDFLQNNRIRIIRQLASTALSSTYLARLSEKKLVVLKESVVPLDSSVGKKAHQLFERECQMLLKLEYPGIARVVDQFVEEGRSYLAIEFVVGMDLRKHIATVGKQDAETVIDWLTQLSDILDYLHTRDPAILHRDITPENLVLSDDDGKIHLIDFGAANQLVENATGTLIGKQSYIAPEQLRGKAVIQSDIYSAGATGYFLLTSKDPEPLSECHPRQLDYAVPAMLDELLAKCTAPEPAQRPSSAMELKRLLAECRLFATSKTA